MIDPPPGPPIWGSRVEITRRIEETLAGRVGANQHSEGLQNFADPAPKGNSRDLAAAAVGWSGETYRQAKRVTVEPIDG